MSSLVNVRHWASCEPISGIAGSGEICTTLATIKSKCEALREACGHSQRNVLIRVGFSRSSSAAAAARRTRLLTPVSGDVAGRTPCGAFPLSGRGLTHLTGLQEMLNVVVNSWPPYEHSGQRFSRADSCVSFMQFQQKCFSG